MKWRFILLILRLDQLQRREIRTAILNMTAEGAIW
jgi:hypothetical protein